MKLHTITLSLLLLGSCGTTRVGGNLGISKVADSDLGGAADQVAVGVEVTSAPEKGGPGCEFGLRTASGSGDSGTWDTRGVSATMVELYGGGRYEWRFEKLRPYVSGGIGIQSFSADVEGQDSASDASPGLYLGGGADYDITDKVFIGLGLRQTLLHESTREGYGDYTYDTNAFQVLLRFGVSL